MAEIVLQFVGVDGDLGSELISWFGHLEPVSHVDAVMPDGTLLGARESGGVKIRPSGYETFTRIVRVVLPATDEQAKTFYDFLRAQIGKPYDMSAIMAFAANRNWQDNDSWFCSELQTAALCSARWFPQIPCAPFNKIDPADLLLLISAFVEVPATWR